MDAVLVKTEIPDGADDVSTEDDFELEFDVSEDDQINEELSDEPLESPEDDSFQLETDTEASSDEVPNEDEPPDLNFEDDFGEYDDALEQETEPDLEPDVEFGEQETIETEYLTDKEDDKTEAPPVLEKQTTRMRNEKKSFFGKFILAIILLFLLVAGAWVASLMTGYKIPYLSDVKIPFIENLIKIKSTEKADIKPIPNQKSVNGRFVTNSTAGTLFVITGTVENPSKTINSHIEIKGVLITKGKVEAKTKIVFCGNIITEDMLKTGNITDINKLLLVKEGQQNANVNIKPGATVPFMLVFSDLPENLQNFTVRVSDFTKPRAN